jgi:hypothetical protein
MDVQLNPPFDEQAALAELDRLRTELESARKRREDSSAEFEAFVRLMKFPTEADDRPPPVSVSLRATSGRVSTRAADFAPIAIVEPVAPVESTGEPPVVAVRWKRGIGVARLAAAVAVTGAVLLVAALFFRGGPSAEPPSRVETTAPAPPAAPPAKPASAPTAPAGLAPQVAPAPRAALTAELIAVRPVWVRVIIDGRRTMQRQLAAGERVPLRADKVINLRAGDAGALRLVVDGIDQGVLGRDGAIATRALMPK